MDRKHEGQKFNVVLFEWRYSETLYKYTLGLHYLTSVLRKANFNVWDLIFEKESVGEVLEHILLLNPDMIGIHFYREKENSIFAFTRKVKAMNPNIKIVLGGHTATLYGAHILNTEPAIDIIAFGEGELTMVDLCNRLKNGQSLEGCKGTFYRKDGVIHRNEDRELIENLDELPYPALDVLLEKHTTSKCVFAAISTSRGCMGKCGFCITNRVFDNLSEKGWRGRSPESVVGEVKYLQEAFPGKRLVYRIVDDPLKTRTPLKKPG
ncbi:MAG TPA: cobalamin-dependent protein [Pseudobacteroides sp.]|uniref:B12-binding domain-containing radical SAM protein n=1 Tax=Pseudobacteroides sp. TaxID=1968840 RepID=UPI002F9226AB